jgi:hypothetical protein
MRSRRRCAVAAATLALAAGALAGCGDEERGSVTVDDGGTGTTGSGTGTTGTGTGTTGTGTAPQATVTTPESSRPPSGGGGAGAGGGSGGGSPESQQGGAGDEVPASSQALLTGRNGRITPRLVRVPPYIAIRVELRSADGERYRLAANGRAVEAGGQLSSASAVYDGLRPGDRLVLTGPSGRVVVEASAEPGP